MFIDPALPIKWRVVRTWPSLLSRACPRLIVDYLEIWRGKWRPGSCIPDDCIWHDGYVSGPKYIHHATIFDTIEEAEMVAMVMENRSINKGAKFLLEVYQR